VDAAPAAARDALHVDLLASMQESSTGGNISRANARNRPTWRAWHQFCEALNLEDFLSLVTDPVPFLQEVFAPRYHNGRCLSLLGQPVQARTVEEAVRAVGRTFVKLGASDPRLNTPGALDVRLGCGSNCPVETRRSSTTACQTCPNYSPTPCHPGCLSCQHCTFCVHVQHDLGCWILLPLLPPPFRFCEDVNLYLGSRRLDLHTAPARDLLTCTSIGLTFTMQKSQPGKVVAQAASGSELACCVCSIACQIYSPSLPQCSC
jgi:hypothetical protein